MSTAAGVLALPLAAWFLPVSRIVSSPYLDEFFHVRQAQRYCAGRFDVWDPKITTPPGLYLVSYLFSRLIGCDISALRAINLLFLGLTFVLVYLCCLARSSIPPSQTAEHVSFNIVLMPTLFFFSALYYTDVASTCSVLWYYTNFIQVPQKRGALSGFNLVILGLISLSFRQTNIFWVAIFPAGITLLKQLDIGHPAVKDSMHRQVEGFGASFYSVARTSWKLNAVFDPPVNGASFEDYLKTILSIVVCGLKIATQPKRLVSLTLALWPFMTILASFAGFVLWNGGVVLGDKSNHIATIHLPQMLYLWVYIAFFSWPLIAPYLLLIPLYLLGNLSVLSALEPMLVFKRRNLAPRLFVLVIATLIAATWIHYNTIVHPFTLADNRHYTFYIFRLLTRPYWMKYVVAPIYIICAWASIQTLGNGPAKNAEPGSLNVPDGQHSANVSFALVWLATSALSLITAPLVEPRYMILPWVFWRMHLPHAAQETGTKQKGTLFRATRGGALWVETAWFLLINGITGFIFLWCGFEWPQEPGNVQRFMW